MDILELYSKESQRIVHVDQTKAQQCRAKPNEKRNATFNDLTREPENGLYNLLLYSKYEPIIKCTRANTYKPITHK